MNLKEKFLKAYINVPDALKDEIVVVVDSKPFSWNSAYFEIKNNTRLSEKILKNLNETNII